MKMQEAFYVLVACIVSALVGWVYAHHVVAKECERLGGFYVGKKVFKCTEVELLPGGQAPSFVAPSKRSMEDLIAEAEAARNNKPKGLE